MYEKCTQRPNAFANENVYFGAFKNYIFNKEHIHTTPMWTAIIHIRTKDESPKAIYFYGFE